MEIKKIILTRGIQGSGKTTWALNWVKEDPEHRVRYNNDDIRNMCGKYWVPSREKLIADVKKSFLLSIMDMGYDCVIDNMNLNPHEVESIKDFVKRNNESYLFNYEYRVETIDFKTPLQECIERDSKRPHPVGAEIITQTYNKYHNFYIE